jgi:hypothetical protein
MVLVQVLARLVAVMLWPLGKLADLLVWRKVR